MARAKKVWITQFYERDRKCLCSIARTGLIEKEDFEKYGVKDGRVKNYIRDNLIEERYCNKSHITVEEYRKYFVTFPCHCGEPSCKGWACV